MDQGGAEIVFDSTPCLANNAQCWHTCPLSRIDNEKKQTVLHYSEFLITMSERLHSIS